MKKLKKDLLICASLFVISMTIYMSNGVGMPGGDLVAARYLPLSLLCEHDLDLNEMPLRLRLRNGKISQPYFLLPARNGRQVATMGPLPGIMAFPVFLVASWSNNRFSYQRVIDLAKLAASLWTALSVVLMYLVLISIMNRLGAVILAGLFGVATSSWSMVSQGLWQHTAAIPWLIAGLLALVRGKENGKWIPWSGLFLGLAVVARPSNIVVAAAFMAYVTIHHRKHLLGFLGLAAIPALAQVWYNMFYFGSPWLFGQIVLNEFLHAHTGLLHQWACPNCASWDTSPKAVFEAFFGLLISPSRGIFVFSPVLLLGLWGLIGAVRKDGDPLLRWSLVAFLSIVTVHAFRHDWWGGWSFGYRFTLDGVPLLILGMVPVWDRVINSRSLTIIAIVLLMFSVMVQAIGAFSYDLTGWNASPDINSHTERLWSITDSQLIYYLKKRKIRSSYHGYDTPPATITVCPVRIIEPTK